MTVAVHRSSRWPCGLLRGTPDVASATEELTFSFYFIPLAKFEALPVAGSHWVGQLYGLATQRVVRGPAAISWRLVERHTLGPPRGCVSTPPTF